jgi:hypothetical protein
MKPEMAHAMNPNSISWACHRVGGHQVPRAVPPMKLEAHTGINTSAAAPARKNWERNPQANRLIFMKARIPVAHSF